MKKGFTLIEMMLVIGIIVMLAAATIGGFSFATKQAQKARGREIVANTAEALNVLFQRQSFWPPRLLAEAGSSRQLTAEAAACLAANGLMSLSFTTRLDEYGKKIYILSGLDRCGIVDPWAADVLKRAPETASASGLHVPSGGTVKDHILFFALDEDGDGITTAKVGGEDVRVRANAIVWSCGMDGVEAPYPYSSGAGSGSKGSNSATRDKSRLADDIYSWQPRQLER